MTNTTSQPRIRTTRIALVILAIASASLLASCASTGSAGATSKLQSLAQRQTRRPSALAINAPAPSGLRLPPIDAATDPDAFEPLEAAIAHFTEQPLPFGWIDSADAKGENPISEEAKTESLKAYIAGRSALVGGDIPEAIRQLDAASALDPTAPAIWHTLADAHWTAGDRLAATASYLRAIQLDPNDTVSLMRVGLSEMDRRNFTTAASLLARAYRSIPDSKSKDAAIPYIVGVALGRTLHQQGWMRAGNESIYESLGELTSFTQPTSFRRELGATIRAAGDAWRDTGDASIRLGQLPQAQDAYERAAAMPTFDEAALLTRRVYASMRLGQPAAAAMLLLDRITIQRGLVDDRTLQLIRYLSTTSGVGIALADSLGSFEQSLSSDERRTAASQLARARAAALPDEKAVMALIDRLIVSPSDASAVSDLLNRRSPEDASGLVALTSQLIEANTIELERYTDALMRYTAGAEALLDEAMQAEPSVGSNLLVAELARELGNAELAESMLEKAAALRPDDPGVRLAQATLAIASGRYADAYERLSTIDSGSTSSGAIAVARAYRRLGDNQRALNILEDRVWGGAATAEEALVAGETSVALGAPIDAEQLFKLAIELDPSQEEAYAGLITLYQNNGTLANQASLADTLRALRQAIPSSQTLRWLRVQDLLRADRLDQAQRELLSLAEESFDPIVIEQLISVWLRTGESETAQTWLTEQIKRRPNRGALVRMLARVQAARKDTDAAIATLESWLETHATDASASRELENILRLESVNRSDDADTIAFARLSRSAPTLRRSIELAPILIRRGNVVEAIETLAEPLANEPRLDPALIQTYAQLVTGAATYAVKNTPDEPETISKGLTLLEQMLERFPQMPPEMHRTLIVLLVQTDADPARIARICVRAGESFTQAPDDFVLEAIQRLVQTNKLEPAFVVATKASNLMQSPPPRLLASWYWLAAVQGDSAIAFDAFEMIEQQNESVRTVAAMNSILNQILVQPASEKHLALSNLAYFAAASFTNLDDDRVASRRFYEIALKHNPRHAMANNNLAYAWVEQGINLDRAHEMLIIAFEESPGSDAVADSLGWVRYKLGMIDDQRDAEGKIVLQGAASLLSAASKLSVNEGAAEILDHLADAQWRLGKTDRAVETWRQARLILRPLLENPNPNAFHQGLLDTVLPKVESKLDAVADGKAPPIEPMNRQRRWTQENQENNNDL